MGRLSCTVYHKPTDVHRLLHSMSNHPPHTTHNIAFAQALRYKKICSEPAEYERQIKLLEDIFIKRGYLLSDIRRQINRALCRSREELLTGEPRRKSGNTRPGFTTIYHPLTGQIGDILRKHWGILQSKPDLHQVFREPHDGFQKGKEPTRPFNSNGHIIACATVLHTQESLGWEFC